MTWVTQTHFPLEQKITSLICRQNSKNCSTNLKRKLQTDRIERVRAAVAGAGLSWDDVWRRSEQVILFGSYAAGCESTASDVDLICVGQGQRLASKELHLLWVKSSVLNDPDWVTTEIGGHVVRYGRWLKGSCNFRQHRAAAPKTIVRKLQKIADRAGVLGEKWARLSPAYRASERLKLRRDIQRLAILQIGEAVPPSPLLDSTWVTEVDKCGWISGVLSTDSPLSKLAVMLVCESRAPSRKLLAITLSESLPRYGALRAQLNSPLGAPATHLP